MNGRYANVIIDRSHEKLDRPFQYRIPEKLSGKIEPGMSVIIPFGASNRQIQGYVVEVTDVSEYEELKIKELIGRAQGGVAANEILIKLALFLKTQYGATMIQALKTVLPVKKTVKALQKKEVSLLLDEKEAKELYYESVRKKQNARVRLLKELIENRILPYGLVTTKLNISPGTLKGLEEKGYVKIDSETVYRNPFSTTVQREEKKELSQEQQKIVTDILSSFDTGIRTTSLIHGITGSGKTEVYMELIQGMIDRGRQAIVLIPEIALTYQTVLRFIKRFGQRVSLMNSTLSQGEKYDQCERARKGEIDVIIGPRSALFTPFERVGLIVIDEEHEGTYKSEVTPRYHARETAEELARLHDGMVVLGSATPSLESYYRTQIEVYRKYQLTSRLTGGKLSKVYIVDLRNELKEGNRSIFSRQLQQLLQQRLDRKEQSMLFLNRRGYAGFISCRSCGHVMKCPHCDISLSEHKNGKLVCHYCGFSRDSVKICPECNSPYILGFRAGTQQIEEKLKQLMPTARILRMDADTTKNKDSYEEILSAFASAEADILIGTQMIVKGHDFPNVTLVGVLAADLSLAAGDYRAAERTFQLLTQAAGRAGRGEKEGEVIIQSYQPEHYSIVHAANQDYEAFYEEEILYRQLMNYPPACNMFAVLITASIEERGEKLAKYLSNLAHKYTDGLVDVREQIWIIGPAPASIGKMNDIYRFVFYVKYSEYKLLTRMKDELENKVNAMELKEEMVQFDFNPMNMY